MDEEIKNEVSTHYGVHFEWQGLPLVLLVEGVVADVEQALGGFLRVFPLGCGHCSLDGQGLVQQFLGSQNCIPLDLGNEDRCSFGINKRMNCNVLITNRLKRARASMKCSYRAFVRRYL